MADQPAQAPAKLRTRMNRAAALRELGLVEQARDELSKLLPELEQAPAADSSTKGRARYHLALCQWRLGDGPRPSGRRRSPSPPTTLRRKRSRSIPASVRSPKSCSRP